MYDCKCLGQDPLSLQTLAEICAKLYGKWLVSVSQKAKAMDESGSARTPQSCKVWLTLVLNSMGSGYFL